jgi:hypothetical protein
MPMLLESRTFRIHWGNHHSNEQKSKNGESGIVQPNEMAMENAIAAVMRAITDGDWDIKASMPLTASEFNLSAAQANRGATTPGFGYSTAFTDGMIFICQRRRLVDDETYRTTMIERDDRMNAAREKNREAFLKDFPVTEKKKLFGGGSFQFRGKDYATREEAETAQNEALAQI